VSDALAPDDHVIVIDVPLAEKFGFRSTVFIVCERARSVHLAQLLQLSNMVIR
jgi:hypothetical protein